MSPPRRKARGGGGGKTSAPFPPSLIPSPDPKAPSKDRRPFPSAAPSALSKSKFHLLLQPRASEPNLKIDSSKVPDFDRPKPRASSAARSRLPSSDGSRSSSSSIRSVASADAPSSTSSAVSKPASAKARAESRPRSGRASPNIAVQRRGVLERQVRDEPPKSTLIGLGRSKVNASAGKEDDKRILKAPATLEEETKKASVVSSKADGPSVEKLSSKETNKTSRTSFQKDNQAESVRWSTTALPLAASVKSTRKSSLDSVRMGVCRTQTLLGKNETRFSTGSSVLSSSRSCKISSDGVLHGQDEPSRQSAGSGVSQGILDEASEYSMHDSCAEHEEVSGACDFSSSLHRRLALLEGKVSRIAAELKMTKKMLDDNDCAGSKSVLSDIQSKISSIEKAMAFGECNEVSASHDTVGGEFKTISTEETAGDSCKILKAPLQVCTSSASSRVSGLTDENQRPSQGHLLRSQLEQDCSLVAPCPQQDCSLVASIHAYAVGTQELERISEEQYLGIAGNLLGGTCPQDMDQTLLHNVSDRFRAVPGFQSLNMQGADNKLLETEPMIQVPPVFTSETKDSHEYDGDLPLDIIHENAENVAPDDALDFEYDECVPNELHPIGDKVAVAGWYASDGDAILLAHDDGSCSYYDVANMEEKGVYQSPDEMSMPLWNDCWLIRAAASDGRSNKYVVAATEGTAIDSGFCSWDLHNRNITAYHSEGQNPPAYRLNQASPTRRCLSSLPLCKYIEKPVDLNHPDQCESPQWWYRPSGPLMASTASSLKCVALYDIRDGDSVVHWETNTAVVSLDYSSPIQWKDRGKLVLAEEEGISVWDVNTMDVNCLQYIEFPGKRISALHLFNPDAECSGGVRQRLSSSDTEAFDGVCCTNGDINILDFRVPNGIGISFSTPGQLLQCVFARQDMVLVGCYDPLRNECCVQQWCVRKATKVCTYVFPPSSCHYSHLSLKQVWGDPSKLVMAVNGNGLHIFKAWKDYNGACKVEETTDVIGTEDLFSPTFDYANSRVLLVSRERQASWCYWAQ